jgi:Zn-dependent protease with chaperone function
MKVFARSLFVLLLLYALVYAIGDWYLLRRGAPPWMGIVLAVALVGVQYLVSPRIIEWLMNIRWDNAGGELPARNRQFLERLCAERGLKMPRIGIVDCPTPNAFSFGRVPADARVAVTTGLLATLSTEETNAVLAHEMGHVEHWDFVVMTLAALAPLVLWHVYSFTRRSDKTENLAIAAYVCYWISQFLILLLNRTREYMADHYAAEVTREPGTLSSALIKISYGMTKADGDLAHAMEGASGKERAQLASTRHLAGAVALMGISNLRSGTALALGALDQKHASALMRWDLVNPWARFYELNSTHPLTALRVHALNREAEALCQPVLYPLPDQLKRDWRGFPLELLLWAAPWVSGAVLVALLALRYRLADWGIQIPAGLAPLLLLLTGVAWILRTWFRYCGKIEKATIGSLMSDVHVSQMRPRAVRLEGEILGFGVPGAFWSPDLVLRDDTGMIFVLYRQSLPFARLIFALTNAGSYIGHKVTVEGWFRRGLRPYLEMSRLTAAGGKQHRAYARWVQHGLASVLIAVALAWLVM